MINSFVNLQEAVKGLIASGMDIVSLTDVTPIPHNGPKPKKQRRLWSNLHSTFVRLRYDIYIYISWCNLEHYVMMYTMTYFGAQ